MAYTTTKKVTIDHTKVGSSDSTDFPFLFSGTYADMAGTGSGGVVTSSSGFDIIFTSDIAGTTLLKWEIESYNTTTGAVNFWIRVPMLSHTANTVIYILYGNSAITTFQGGTTGAAWDSGFAAVYHMSTTNQNADSTANANTLTPTAITSVTGQIDGGASLNGTSSQFARVSSASLQITPNLSLSIWVKPTSVSQSFVFTRGAFDWVFSIGEAGSGSLAFFNGSAWIGSATGIVTAGAWNHIAVTHDGTNDRWYVNGVAKTPTTDVHALPTSTGALTIGSASGSNFFPGLMDEAHISNVIRSADWILAEFNNQNSPSTFYSLTSIFSPQVGAFMVGL